MRHLAAVGLLAVSLAAAADGDPGFPKEEACRLLSQLSDDDEGRRKIAFDGLVKLAETHLEGVLALIPPSELDPDLRAWHADLRARCEEIRKGRRGAQRLGEIDPRLPDLTKDPVLREAALALLPEPTLDAARGLYKAVPSGNPYDAARILACFLPKARTADGVSDLLAAIGQANGLCLQVLTNDLLTGRLEEDRRRELVSLVAPFLEHANDQVRQAAGVALCDLKAAEYAEQILALVPEYRPYMKHRIDAQLTNLDPVRIREAMLGFLVHKERTARETAVRTLGILCPGDTALAKRVLPLLTSDPYPPVRKEAFNAIGAFLGWEEALPFLAARVVGDTSGLAHDNMSMKFTGAAGQTEAVRHGLAKWLDDPRWWVRLRAMGYMGEWQKLCPHVLPAVEGLLADPHEKVRVQAIIRLGRIGDRSSVPKLASFLDDMDPYVQVQAGISIGILVEGDWVEARTKWARIPAKPDMSPDERAARMAAEMKYKDAARHARDWWEANKETFGKEAERRVER